MRDMEHECAHLTKADKSAKSTWCNHVNMDQHLKEDIFNILWSLPQKELKLLWKQREVLPSISMVFLIRYLVNVYRVYCRSWEARPVPLPVSAHLVYHIQYVTFWRVSVDYWSILTWTERAISMHWLRSNPFVTSLKCKRWGTKSAIHSLSTYKDFII